jgi:hypothetical protein
MTADRFVADHFLKALDGIDFREPEPDHILDRRARLADMVLTEVDGDDIEALALRALASATLQLCMFAGDLVTAESWVQALRTYTDVVHL